MFKEDLILNLTKDTQENRKSFAHLLFELDRSSGFKYLTEPPCCIERFLSINEDLFNKIKKFAKDVPNYKEGNDSSLGEYFSVFSIKFCINTDTNNCFKVKIYTENGIQKCFCEFYNIPLQINV